MEHYKLLRTDTADSGLQKIILSIAENFGSDIALEKFDKIEHQLSLLADNPMLGTDPRYMVLRRQGYKVLITDKDLVFYKVDEKEKTVTVYAIVDPRQDYLDIIRGL